MWETSTARCHRVVPSVTNHEGSHRGPRPGRAHAAVMPFSAMERAKAEAMRRYPAAVGCTSPAQHRPESGAVAFGTQTSDHSCIGVYTIFIPFVWYCDT